MAREEYERTQHHSRALSEVERPSFDSLRTDEEEKKRRADVGVMDGVESIFTRMIGIYAIRPFLRKLDDFVRELEDRKLEEARRRWEICVDEMRGGGGRFDVRNAIARVQVRMTSLRKRLQSNVNGLCRHMKKGKRELCFGEIGSGDRLPRQNGRWMDMERRSSLREGLLWYYGNAGIIAFRKRREVERANSRENAKIENKRVQVCVAIFIDGWDEG